VGTRKKKFGNAPKIAIFNNYTIMQRCYARDSLSFVHLCDVCTLHRKSEQKDISSSQVTLNKVWKRVSTRPVSKGGCLGQFELSVVYRVLLLSSDYHDLLFIHFKPTGNAIGHALAWQNLNKLEINQNFLHTTKI